MRNSVRRTATKVRDGQTQFKNRWTTTPNNFDGVGVAIERKRPGTGFRHVLTQNDIFEFLRLVPRWNALSVGLNRIVLDHGSQDRFGWYHRGGIGLNAMESDLDVSMGREAFYRDIEFFDRVGVEYRTRRVKESWEEGMESWVYDEQDDWANDVYAVCRFTRDQARCFHLVRTLLHELGHHLDQTTNPKRWCSRGERFAENAGRHLERTLWNSYCRRFGSPVAK